MCLCITLSAEEQIHVKKNKAVNIQCRNKTHSAVYGSETLTKGYGGGRGTKGVGIGDRGEFKAQGSGTRGSDRRKGRGTWENGECQGRGESERHR